MRFEFIMGVAALALTACSQTPIVSHQDSLTGPEYQGKKYYFGWGEVLDGMMGNETRYDVLHTHNIFTKNIGGDYIGRKLIDQEFGGSAIRSGWNQIGQSIHTGDMYLQYSSGHGSPNGLGVGVSYDEMRDKVLSYPVKEAIVFTMSCFSGNLVDSFNNKRSVWGDWQRDGKTLFVMASSRSNEESSTGPGEDPDEPNGPYGSAGSAFGHALWKALIGYADGAVDGHRDGVIQLGEIAKYVVADTLREGGHTPVFTGSYNSNLAINRVPTIAEAVRLLGDTDDGRTQLDKLIADGVLVD